MSDNHRETRILALEIRARRVGFAVLEGSHHLLDWGTKRWKADGNAVKYLAARIDPLLFHYSPSVVVLKDIGSKSRAKRKATIADARRNLLKRAISVSMVKPAEVRLAFIQSGGRNKFQIASAVAQMFPELKWRLPAKRRPWQAEPYNSAMFDAVALAFTHWKRYCQGRRKREPLWRRKREPVEG